MRQLPITSQGNQIARQQEIEYIVLPDTEDGQKKNLQTYLRLLRRRKWLIIAPLFLFLPFAFMQLTTQKALYKATATVLIEPINPHIISIEEVVSAERKALSPDFYRTQYEIISSPLVIGQVVDALRLYDEKASQEESSLIRRINTILSFPGSIMNNVLSIMKAHFSGMTYTEKPLEKLEQDITVFEGMISAYRRESDSIEKRRENLIAQLQNSLIVEARQGTQLVNITLKGSNSAKIAQQANKVAEVYVKQNLDNKLDASRNAIVWLKKEAKELKEKIGNAESSLRDFKKRNNFVPPSEMRELKDPSIDKLNALQDSYIRISIDRDNLRSQIEEIKKLSNKDVDVIMVAIPILSKYTSLNHLLTRYIDLKTHIHRVSEKFGENHPQLFQIKSEIDKIKGAIYSEMEKLIRGMHEEYKLLSEREKYLEKSMQEQRKESVDFSNKFVEYQELKQELEIDKELHLALSKRLAETTLTEALETNNIKVLQLASVPNYPLPSGSSKKIVLSVVVSLVLGIGLAICVENLDKRFKSVEEAERYLGVSFLGVVPRHKTRRNKPVTLYNPETSAAEAYRTLRTWIRLSSPKPIKTLLITSANLGEGKSHIAANLAISFAQLGQMVLLVDADLRRPTLHHAFNLTNRTGLIDILERGAEWESVLQNTALENLKVLATGGRPHNPAELLSTQRMQSLLGNVKDTFDIVIVDAPITLTIPDVVILVSAIDAALLVHCPLKGNRESVLEAKKTLDRAGANILGMIFNNLKAKMQTYYGHPQGPSQYSGNSIIVSRQRQRDMTFVDMRPTENAEKWIAASPPSHNPSHHNC